MRHLIPVPPPHVEGGLPEGVTFMGFFAAVGAVTVAIIVLALLWHAARAASRVVALWLSERAGGVLFWRHEAEVARERVGELQRKTNRQAEELQRLQSLAMQERRRAQKAEEEVATLKSESMAGRYAYLISQLQSNVPLRNDGRLRAVGEFAHELLKGLENQP